MRALPSALRALARALSSALGPEVLGLGVGVEVEVDAEEEVGAADVDEEVLEVVFALVCK